MVLFRQIANDRERHDTGEERVIKLTAMSYWSDTNQAKVKRPFGQLGRAVGVNETNDDIYKFYFENGR